MSVLDPVDSELAAQKTASRLQRTDVRRIVHSVLKPTGARMSRVQQLAVFCEPPLETKRERVLFRGTEEPTHLFFAVDDIR
jgi:hypothetical protein